MFRYGRLRLSAEHNLKWRLSYYAETKLKPMPFCPSRRGGGLVVVVVSSSARSNSN